MNLIIRKVVDNVFKNYKPFFINIGTYQDTLVRIWALFDNFWPLNLYVQDEASICPKYEASIHSMLFPNFSLQCSRPFLTEKRINKFLTKNGSLCQIFGFLIKPQLPMIPRIGIHDAFISLPWLCPNFLSGINGF